jgi:hypothetical protein
VVDSHLVSTLKALPISLAIPIRHMRMPKLIAVVHIRTAMIVVVLTRPFNTIVKSVAMYFVELRRRSIPIVRLPVTHVYRRP